MPRKGKKVERKKGIVESFLGGMPMFGDFFKELGKTEVFKEKFKEVDEKIEENLREGQKKKWGFEANVSMRPIIKPILKDIKKGVSELYIGKDYFYGKKEGELSIAIKVPKEDVDINIKGKNLLITAGKFKKNIELPNYFKNIKKRKYKNGILVLELTK